MIYNSLNIFIYIYIIQYRNLYESNRRDYFFYTKKRESSHGHVSQVSNKELVVFYFMIKSAFKEAKKISELK